MGTKKLIVSLVPGATEMVAAVGALDQLVGVSHECDWPPQVRALPRMTTTPIDPARASLEIDQAVRQAVAHGVAVIGIDAARLRALHPDLLITQQLCDVCAVSDGQTLRLADAMDHPPEVLTLTGTTLAGVWDDIRAVGRASGHDQAGDALAGMLAARVAACLAEPASRRPRVVALEWLDPPFLAGHWVPEMIAAAGGVDIGATAGSHSTARRWPEISRLEPDVVLISLCGFDAARAQVEYRQLTDPLARHWLSRYRIAFLDGNAYTSRAGPRLLEGITVIRNALAA